MELSHGGLLVSAPYDTQFDLIDLVGRGARGNEVDVVSRGV
jgi:hypothetical protein